MEKVRPQVKGKEIYLEIMRRKIEKSNRGGIKQWLIT